MAADGVVDPFADGEAVCRREFRLRMEPVVIGERHGLFADGFADVFEVAPSCEVRFAGFEPFGEVDVFAAVFDVFADGPGDGSDVGVPGPNGLVGVAVEAGAVEDVLDGGGGLHSGRERAGGV